MNEALKSGGKYAELFFISRGMHCERMKELLKLDEDLSDVFVARPCSL